MASEGKRRRGAAATKATAARPPVRKRSSWTDMFALDSERSSRLLLIGGVVLVLLIAVGFVGFGYYYSVIKPRNRTVLEADGIKISYSGIERRMRYEADQHPEFRQSVQTLVQVLPESVSQTLLNEITLISRGPSDQGVTVDDSEAEAALRLKIGVAPDADQRRF